MATSEDAILAIRHVVQEHGDAHTRLGRAARIEGMQWFGRLLGWSWPRNYVEVLGKHDGVLVQDAIVFGFLESIDAFLLYHDAWHRPAGYWPVAGDGCGNYFCLALRQSAGAEEEPVVFFEMIESRDTPARRVANSYAAFVAKHMRDQCLRLGCTSAMGGDRPQLR